MFLHLFVFSQGGMDPPGGRSPGRNTGPDRNSSDGHQSGRYASYWNAYLLIKYFKIIIALDKLKENIKYDFSLLFIKSSVMNILDC